MLLTYLGKKASSSEARAKQIKNNLQRLQNNKLGFFKHIAMNSLPSYRLRKRSQFIELRSTRLGKAEMKEFFEAHHSNKRIFHEARLEYCGGFL